MTQAAPWTVAAPDPDLVARLSKELDLVPVAAACMANRGLTDPAEATSFLEPRLASLSTPEGMADLDRAASRLADAVDAGERVAVFGDYDVDGVSSTALITTFLRQLDVEVDTHFADRFSGYGMVPGVVDRMVERGCSLILAVDCGTSDHQAAARAREAGIDLIVLDHHRIEGAHPDVYAFVNPEREDCSFGDRTLAAVGIVFYFAAATRSVLAGRGRISRDEVDVKELLDLVALGTVADVMPLKGNNRILVKHGLRWMSERPRSGLKSLTRSARIRSRVIRSDHIAYQLAPRLNAAGRLSNASDAFELLTASSLRAAEPLAARLDQLSAERRQLEERVIDEAKQTVVDRRLMEQKVLVVSGDGWHRGVLGIVAARLVEWARRPAFVIGFDGDVGIGSARSRGELNLHESLTAAREHLIRFGGHRDAAGFTVARDNLGALEEILARYADSHCSEPDDEDFVCDASLNPSQITPGLLTEIARIGPFGSGNPEPVFDIDGLYVLDSRLVGRDHLKLELKTPTGSVSAFGPRMGSSVESVPPLIRVAANLTADEWRGDGTPELRLVAVPVAGS